MKEITECIGDIGWANSYIFTTLDVTSHMCKNCLPFLESN